jgi:predicted transcriptional regulator
MQPTIVLRLDPRVRHNLEQIARATGVSQADIVAEGVRLYIDARVEELVAQGVLAVRETTKEEKFPDEYERYNTIV